MPLCLSALVFEDEALRRVSGKVHSHQANVVCELGFAGETPDFVQQLIEELWSGERKSFLNGRKEQLGGVKFPLLVLHFNEPIRVKQNQIVRRQR